MISRCKANAMTTVRLARESGKLNAQGLAMLDELSAWLASDTCQFAMLGFGGDAPTGFDSSMLQHIYTAYKAEAK